MRHIQPAAWKASSPCVPPILLIIVILICVRLASTPSLRLRSDQPRSSSHAGALPGWSSQSCARRADTRRSWTERRHTPVAYLNGAFLQREALPHRRWCIEPFTDNSGAVYLISASVSRHAREALALRREREFLVPTARPDSASRVRSTSCGWSVSYLIE